MNATIRPVMRRAMQVFRPATRVGRAGGPARRYSARGLQVYGAERAKQNRPIHALESPQALVRCVRRHAAALRETALRQQSESTNGRREFLQELEEASPKQGGDRNL